ncbi:hypothetical protein E3C22_13625 [Jiella endophytica]|uniref:Uncharacterized protein n=1 Tax=Jiella endophytica TaxID=2558362 RepID=A0A4Y8RH24_9HYPH|nr:hypothetical protein [Jiella endophytica]TFF21726.1 hypothetical protein E3C22_13625 [Jiella endophytica]
MFRVAIPLGGVETFADLPLDPFERRDERCLHPKHHRQGVQPQRLQLRQPLDDIDVAEVVVGLDLAGDEAAEGRDIAPAGLDGAEQRLEAGRLRQSPIGEDCAKGRHRLILGAGFQRRRTLARRPVIRREQHLVDGACQRRVEVELQIALIGIFRKAMQPAAFGDRLVVKGAFGAGRRCPATRIGLAEVADHDLQRLGMGNLHRAGDMMIGRQPVPGRRLVPEAGDDAAQAAIAHPAERPARRGTEPPDDQPTERDRIRHSCSRNIFQGPDWR